ncbi:non-ribosomal peptide synthetase [Paenibacillus sp. S-38]|uniref:non-ribosomal peptide synthetase n=1 Tax=Paenibacillus sp. S-38 TaxID=3416710 RepID=UPI003CF52BEF
MNTTVSPEMYSLTNAQQRVWFMQQLHSHSSLMNIGLLLKLRAPVQTGLLEQAILLFIRENESLRLVLTPQHSGDPRRYTPRQYLQHALTPCIPVLDYQKESDPAEAARAWAAGDLRLLFNLDDGFLTRFTILRIAPSETWLYIKAHHIHADGAALTYAGREIARIYLELSQGADIPSEEKPVYTDAVERERSYLESGRYELDARFWEEQFEGQPEPLFPVPEWSGTSLQSGRWETVIGPGLRSQIDRFCSDAGITAYHFFLAAAYVWLYRLTGRRDLTLGGITSNRTHPADKATYGMFANTLAIRHRSEPGSSFMEHCRSVSRQYTRLLRHQKYPFNHLVAKLREKHPNLGKVYQVGIEFQMMDSGEEEGIPFDLEPLFSGMLDEELVVHIKDYGAQQSYGVILEYKLATFEQEQIKDWGGRFMRLLEAAAAYPSLRLAELPVLSAEERRRILVDFNASPDESSADDTVIGLFREQVRRTPDAAAVEWGGACVTYRELAERSELLAGVLRHHGLKPEDTAALLLPRGVQLISAMLAVMTAGGAYLSVDPDYPEDRIRYMLQDSGARLLISDEATVERLASDGMHAWGEGTRILTLEGMLSGMEACQGSLLPEPPAGSLAYLIYTSGTTGQPKGVEIEHRGLAHLIGAEGRVMGLSGSTRMLQFASSSFDASVAEIFPVLCHGGTLVVEPREALLPGEPLLRLIRDSKVNTACLTPSVLTQLAMEPDWQEYAAGLHTVVTAGEACPDELAAAWGEGRRLINGYGPTEASVWATYQEYEEERPFPIGRPFGRSQIYLLDENLQPVPPGITGELYIGGPALARGYRNRPELTAGRFIQLELGEGFSGPVRAYRTGDRARYSPDGCIEYCGRTDHQVKLRGHRVELEEVEAVLEAHPHVVQACVTVTREEPGGGEVLSAYIVGGGSPKPDTEVLREWLRERLPRYMVPHRLRFLSELPLTASGKVDRARLSVHTGEEKPPEEAAPFDDEFQSALAEIWREALGCSSLRLTDNFFDRGGDSFRLLHLHRRVREKWGFSLSVPDLFRYPTIQSLALHLAVLKNGAAPVEEAPERRENLTAPGLTVTRKAEMERQKRLRRKGREQ